jgi:hypothetical protein
MVCAYPYPVHPELRRWVPEGGAGTSILEEVNSRFPRSGCARVFWDLSNVTLKLVFSGPQAAVAVAGTAWANPDAAKSSATTAIFTNSLSFGEDKGKAYLPLRIGAMGRLSVRGQPFRIISLARRLV